MPRPATEYRISAAIIKITNANLVRPILQFGLALAALSVQRASAADDAKTLRPHQVIISADVTDKHPIFNE